MQRLSNVLEPLGVEEFTPFAENTNPKSCTAQVGAHQGLCKPRSPKEPPAAPPAVPKPYAGAREHRHRDQQVGGGVWTFCMMNILVRDNRGMFSMYVPKKQGHTGV